MIHSVRTTMREHRILVCVLNDWLLSNSLIRGGRGYIPWTCAGTRLGGGSLLGDREGVFGRIESGGCQELPGVTGEGGGRVWMHLGEGRLLEDGEGTRAGWRRQGRSGSALALMSVSGAGTVGRQGSLA
jgi:hypothetical protein